MSKLGYFGGTFDPPHLGHLILAGEGFFQLELDHLYWILTPLPPHKPHRQVSPIRNRLEMIKILLNQEPDFSLSRVDIDREPPYYAADTMQIIRKLHPEDEIYYLIGEDSLRDLPTWYDVLRFLEVIDYLAVFARPGIDSDVEELTDQLPALEQKLIWLTGPEVQISSTDIRQRIGDQRPYRYYLSPQIHAYLEEHPIYPTTQEKSSQEQI